MKRKNPSSETKNKKIPTQNCNLKPQAAEIFFETFGCPALFVSAQVCVFFNRKSQLHPGRLTWNIIMEVWMIIFLSKWVIFRFHVNLPGCNGLGPDGFGVLGSPLWKGLLLKGTRWARGRSWQIELQGPYKWPKINGFAWCYNTTYRSYNSIYNDRRGPPCTLRIPNQQFTISWWEMWVDVVHFLRSCSGPGKFFAIRFSCMVVVW